MDEQGRHKLSPEWEHLLAPSVGQLPSQSDEQLRGIQAANIVALALSRIAFVHPIESGSDIGIDFVCELRRDRFPTGRLFNVQCKARPASDDGSKDFISVPISVRTVRYWFEQPSPTLLLVSCPKEGKLFWTEPASQAGGWKADWREQGEVSVRVERASAFSCFGDAPAGLLRVANQGSSRLGLALQERSYSIEKMAKHLAPLGHSKEGQDLAPLLKADESTVQESIQALRSIQLFHRRMVSLLTARIETHLEVLSARSEDAARRAFAHAGLGSDYRQWPDLLELQASIDQVRGEISGLQGRGAGGPLTLDGATSDLESMLPLLATMEGVNTQVLFWDDMNEEDARRAELDHDMVVWAATRDPSA